MQRRSPPPNEGQNGGRNGLNGHRQPPSAQRTSNPSSTTATTALVTTNPSGSATITTTTATTMVKDSADDLMTAVKDDDFLRSRFSSPTSPTALLSPAKDKAPLVIAPPTLRPQHVYAPVAPLGMLSLGVLSKHKDEAVGSASDIRNIIYGKYRSELKDVGRQTLRHFEEMGGNFEPNFLSPKHPFFLFLDNFQPLSLFVLFQNVNMPGNEMKMAPRSGDGKCYLASSKQFFSLYIFCLFISK